jgi:hypothetical protein
MSSSSSSLFYRLDLIFNKQASLDNKSLHFKSRHEKLAKKDSSSITTASRSNNNDNSDEIHIGEQNRKTAVFSSILGKKKLKQKSSTCSDFKSLTYEDCDEYNSTHANRFDQALHTEIFMDDFDKKLMAP